MPTIIFHFCENFKHYFSLLKKLLYSPILSGWRYSAMTIGERILHLRNKHSLTQSALATKAGVPVSTISMLEAGVRSGEGLTVGTAKKLARALVVTLDQLTGMYEESDSEYMPAA